jgi:hypothetical protein
MLQSRRRRLIFIAAAMLGLACARGSKSSERPDSTLTARQAERRSSDSVVAHADTSARSTLGRLASAYLDRHRYAAWAPAAGDDSAMPDCAGHDNGASDGVEINALWGIARYTVIAAQPDEQDSTNVNVGAEVVRMLSVEGDPTTSDGNYAKADMVVAEPVVDTLWLAFHRTSDDWVHCGFVWHLQDEVMSPIALTGPPADTILPRGLPIARWVPSRMSWSRVRAMADSLARP